MPGADLDWILERTAPLWADLAGQDLFLSGGTGFFGRWLLESFLAANDRLDLRARVTVLSRDPARFRARFPHLGDHPAVRWHQGEITAFTPPAGRFPFVIHGATEASVKLNLEAPLVMFDTITAGTRRVLDLAAGAGTRRFLFVSSGAVYGPQPPDLPLVAETHPGAPDPFDPAAAYGLGKRAAEFLGAVWGREPGRAFTAARCYAFVGPHLPLDQHFAAAQFIRAGRAGGPIVVAGDGRPVRSYLYAADLAVWLWTILLRGAPGEAYNVGSDQPVSIRELADRVAAAFSPSPAIEVCQPPGPGPAPRYVPSIDKARRQLGLDVGIPLDDGIRRTVAWHQAGGADPRAPNPRDPTPRETAPVRATPGGSA
ncbi:MAG: NAD(P)-dependent oxidoreductase [Candidatus Riflebacteria bacterium]|nr:NAD(P)-dependent oxidoreductase [Candidatus Riflebacteria bacterium]